MIKNKERIFTKDFLIICFCMFASSYVLHALNSSVPLYVDSMGLKTSLSGTLNTCFTLCACIARLTGGHLADRFGRKQIITIGALIFSVSTAIYTYSSVLPMLLIFRGVQGIGYALMSIGAATALVDVLPAKRYGEGLGFSALASTLAGSTAPSVVIWVSGSFDFTTVFLSTAAVALCGALAAVLFCSYEKKSGRRTAQKAAAPAEKGTRSLALRLFEKQALAPALVQTLVGTGFAFAHVYMTLYAVSEGIANPGLYFTFSSVAAVLTRIVGGRLADKDGYVTPCLAVGFIFGIASFLILSFTKVAVIYYLCGAMWGIGQGLISPITNRLAILGVEPARRGAASATYSISADIGNGLGGIIWGLVIERATYVFCFRCIAVWEFVTFIIAMIYMRRRNQVKVQ